MGYANGFTGCCWCAVRAAMPVAVSACLVHPARRYGASGLAVGACARGCVLFWGDAGGAFKKRRVKKPAGDVAGLVYTRIGSSRGNPQSTIMQCTQNIHTHSNGTTAPSRCCRSFRALLPVLRICVATDSVHSCSCYFVLWLLLCYF